MSLFQRIQPYVFTGLLATFASSCPPDRFFRSETDPDDRMTCPVRSLPPLTDGPDGVGRALSGLAGLGVSPDTFHLENLDRFQPLEPLCSAAQINRFDGLQETISARIAAMEPARIADTLEGFYRSAYVYRDSDRTMALGDSPVQQDAKRRLDFWIAAIDQRAYSDKAFLDRIWAEPRIRTVMALNSPNLNPIDRGFLELMFRAEPRGDEGLKALFRERPMEGYTRLFDWLRTYDGRKENFSEEPIWRSLTETFVVLESRFGADRVLRLNHEVFPREAMTRLMEERGYGPAYRAYLAMGAEDLIRHYHEVLMALSPQARPATRRSLVEDLLIMGTVFDDRGMDPTRELQRRAIDQMVAGGQDREDAELLMRLQTGAVPITYDRLDDYRARHALLDEYRALYRDILTLPLEQVFSPESRGRYGMWGALILNRSLSKIPIFLDDLDAVRDEVQAQVVSTMRFGSAGYFGLGSNTSPEWLMPSDLGLCDSPTGGSMVTAGLVTFNGRSANDLICSNVEFMAVLPPSMELEHALATAIGVFGVITVRSLDHVSDGDRLHDEPWHEGSLLEVLTHEAGHIDYFRSNFDQASQRLPMSLQNERHSYLTGKGYYQNYFLNGLSHPEESGTVATERLQFLDELVAISNENLALPRGNDDPDYWDPHWDAEQPFRYAIQPPDLLAGRRFEERVNRIFGEPTNADLEGGWVQMFERAVSLLPPEERRFAREGLARISSPTNTSDASVYFLQSDPFTRAVNRVRVAYRMQPLTFIDLSAADWTALQRAMGRYVVQWRRMESLQPPAARPRPVPHRRPSTPH